MIYLNDQCNIRIMVDISTLQEIDYDLIFKKDKL